LSIVLSNSNILTFLIFICVLDFDNLFVFDVEKLISAELEDLPPMWVGAYNFHLFWATIAHNLPWPSWIDFGLDCQWFLIEPEDLSVLSISSLSN
jgi:hypothetical protein